MKARLKQLMFTNETGYSILPVFYQVEEGRLKLNLTRYAAVVLVREEEETDDDDSFEY